MHHGLGCKAEDRILTLYNYDRSIVDFESGRVHDIISGIVDLFDRMGSHTNMSKTKVMIYTPGYLWGKL